MSWKPEIQTVNDEKYYQNNLCFATKEEAEASAADIFNRWMLATNYRAAESDDPVNYRIVDGVMEAVTESVSA